MALVLRAAPAAEPVSLEEVKAHLRIDGDAEDALVASLMLTSRLHIEAALGLALMMQSWTLNLDNWPRKRPVLLPLHPVVSVGEVRILRRDVVPHVLSSDAYQLDDASRPARLHVETAAQLRPDRPLGGIEIDFVAGYGTASADVPAPVRQALMMLVAHWYEHRDPIEIGAPVTSVPHNVNRLLNPYRPVRM